MLTQTEEILALRRGNVKVAGQVLFTACQDSFPRVLDFQVVSPLVSPPALAPGGRTHLTSTASSITVMSVLHFADGLMASSAGGITKLLLRGSHMPSPRV